MAKKNEMVFVDERGMNWSTENIKDLIRGYHHFKEFLEICEYYGPNLEAMLKIKPKKR